MLTIAHPCVAEPHKPSQPARVRLAIVEPEAPHEPLHLPDGAKAKVILRTDITPEGMEQLAEAAVAVVLVVLVDLRQTCTTRIRATLRLLRLILRNAHLVAITSPGPDTSAQCRDANAHIGMRATPAALLRAIDTSIRDAQASRSLPAVRMNA